MFMNAKKVTSVAAAPKSKAAAKAFDILPGLEEVAALDACAKAIKALLDLKKSELKEVATAQLIENGLKQHSRPDVVRFADGEFATGRATITKRSSVSPLSTDELSMLTELLGAELPDFVETVEKHPAMLAVNPAYANDESLLKRIDKALSGIKGVPEDFIVQIEAESKVVVSDTATDAVFRLDADVTEQVFPLIAGVSLGSVFSNITKAWEIVKPLLLPDAKAEVKKMLKASLKAAS
jgi:hypothetical protein